MKLYELVKETENNGISKDSMDVEIENLTCNSSEVGKGSLFFALKGFGTNGEEHIPQAVQNGAVAVVSENFHDFKPQGCVFVQVRNCRRALAVCASRFFGDPKNKLCIIGITGTNGKTTTAHMIAHVLTESGIKCGIIGTVGAEYSGISEISDHTTPEPITLHRILRDMAKNGITHVVMEVSSHALHQERVYGIDFKIGIFTNLSAEHLDYHGNMRNYAETKLKLFRQSEICIANKDSDFSEPFVNFRNGKGVYTVSAHADADYRCENINVLANGNRFDIVKANTFTPIRMTQSVCGFFNVYNGLTAFAAGDILGVDPVEISAYSKGFSSVRGRMEKLETDTDYTVMIDFAHTPDGLGNVLNTLRACCKGKILTVFGCGGNRDKTKRPVMGKIAAALSDVAVITSDNPRDEDPEKIIEDILSGVFEKTNAKVIPDRREAIGYALMQAKKNDVVLLAGKGHETYQTVKGENLYFNEREIVAEILKSTKFNK